MGRGREDAHPASIDSKLYNAARAGDEARVSQLIDQASVDWRDDHDWTALHWAAQSGHIPVVIRLLDAGWSLEARDNTGFTPLTWAAQWGHLETVQCLLLRGAEMDTQSDNKMTPLHWASIGGHTEVTKTLLLCGANQQIRNKDGNTAEDRARNEETRAVFREFQQLMPQTQNSLLQEAINDNHFVAVILILRGAKLEGGDTFEKLIEISEEIFDEDFVEALVSRGTNLSGLSYRKIFELFHLADAHKKTEMKEKIEDYLISKIQIKDEFGNTPLHSATLYNDDKSLKILLEKNEGMHFEKNTRGQIPLDIAIGNEKIFRMVLIDFLSFALKTKDFKKDEFQKKLWDTLNRFCVKSRSGLTLLQYIAEKGMVKEREELLQLLIKMDKHKHKENFNEEESEKRIIKILRTGMKPSKGLKETIDSLQEKHSWTKEKMVVMGLLSTLLSLSLLGLVALDVGTDINFTAEMFSHTTTNYTEELDRCRTSEKIPKLSNVPDFCDNHGLDAEACLKNISSVINKCNQYKERFQQPDVWQEIGIVAAIHIILPFVSIICFSVLFIVNKIISIDWFLPLRIPWPPLTKTYETILDWKIYENFTDKQKDGYERQNEKLMTKVADHQLLTNLALIIEASFESSFQFFFQGVFLFPTVILACMDVSGASELTNLVNWRIVSIIISFLSFSWTSLNIRNRNKAEVFDWKHFLVLFVKIVCDASFRLTIFGAWMYTFRDGVFCTKDTVAYYYVMVLLMIILNSIFSWLEGDMEPCLSLRIWIGIFLNGLLSVLTFNSFDFHLMLGKVKESEKSSRYHKSTTQKQFFYYLIIIATHLVLTIWTAVLMTDEMRLIDVTGRAHPIGKYNTGWILGAGWIFFGVSFLFHCIFYKIHPSAVDVSIDAIKRRLLSEGGCPKDKVKQNGEIEMDENLYLL